VHEEGLATLANPIQIMRNTEDMVNQEQPVYRDLRGYLLRGAKADVFESQDHARAATAAMLNGTETESLDVVDMLAALRSARLLLAHSIADRSDGRRLAPNLYNMINACAGEIVQALPGAKNQRFVESGASLETAYNHLFYRGQSLDDPLMTARRAHERMNDRYSVLIMAAMGNLLLNPPEGETSPYAVDLPASEARTLSNVTAETMERLHLLKAYPITPFEVKADKLGLAWDIAVMPAIDEKDQLEDGAIADFFFMFPNKERSSLELQFRQDEEDEMVTKLVVGDRNEAFTRFRLHDNGQLSHGVNLRNEPSDLAERQFAEIKAWPAFVRLRSLMVALAFDAQVPEEVVSGPHVRGGVGQAIGERPDVPLTRRLTELVLRRQNALRMAGVSEHQRTARGWPQPQHHVRGHFVKLPSGASPRSTAEAEAREYYAEVLHRDFPGLPEGSTWRIAHEHGTGPEQVVYRRARFRGGSLTAEYLASLGLSGVGRRRKT